MATFIVHDKQIVILEHIHWSCNYKTYFFFFPKMIFLISYWKYEDQFRLTIVFIVHDEAYKAIWQ